MSGTHNPMWDAVLLRNATLVRISFVEGAVLGLLLSMRSFQNIFSGVDFFDGEEGGGGIEIEESMIMAVFVSDSYSTLVEVFLQ